MFLSSCPQLLLRRLYVLLFCLFFFLHIKYTETKHFYTCQDTVQILILLTTWEVSKIKGFISFSIYVFQRIHQQSRDMSDSTNRKNETGRERSAQC